MTPLEWTNQTRTTTFIQHDTILPSINSSKSSSSKSCTLPSLPSTKNSRLSTPSLSSSDGKGKRPLSFSPMQQSIDIHTTPPRILPPLIEPNDIQCQWSGCDLLFSTPNQLTDHIRSVHIDRIDSRTWSCQWQTCTRSQIPFKSLYSLFLHLRIHTQDRPFQCSHVSCNKTFTRAEYLRLHERSHTGEKPYQCDYPDCTKAFSNPSDRTKHIKRTHLNKKEYICQIAGCNKSYTDPSSLRKHVKTIHGEDAFKQKKHKRTDDTNDKHFPFEPEKENLSNIISSSWNVTIGNDQSNIFIGNNNTGDDDDDDVVVDQNIPLNIDILGNDLGELTVDTTIYRPPLMNSFKNLTKKPILPAIHVTGVCETEFNQGQQYPVAFRSPHCYRVSAQSGSTAYGSMRSDSINIESALCLPSNHSSMISLTQNPSASPYEYDFISNENIKNDTTNKNSLRIPIKYSPIRKSCGSTTDQSLSFSRVNSTTSHLSSILTNDLSSSNDLSTKTTMNPDDSKMTHLLYFLQTLDYDPKFENEN